jgi:hypothetical protein
MILVGQPSVQKGSEIYTQILNNMYKYDALYVLSKLRKQFLACGIQFDLAKMFWLWDDLTIEHRPQMCLKALEKYAFADRTKPLMKLGMTSRWKNGPKEQ